ncbi:MAG: 2-amino-4-hydroxy-6-hydroxymethyldihydropteridine diphosphokinase [candidate division WOR-3 bacterium]
MSLVYLSLGSNLGNREENLNKAIQELSKIARILRISNYYETKPYGYHKQPDFINCAVSIETSLTPQELLKEIKNIEKRLGRENRERWRERIIDIDILYYDNLIINQENLKIPHPDLEYREFVLKPLSEIAEDFLHPILKKSTKNLLEELRDKPYVDFLETPPGKFFFAVRGNEVVQTSFKEIRGRRENNALLEQLKNRLMEYFGGKPTDFSNFTLRMENVPPFYQRVYHYLRNYIKWGSVITYGELAIKVGCKNGGRAIGNAMARNPFPILVPCHRVLRKGNKLGGFGGGENWKKYLLSIEGIVI